MKTTRQIHIQRQFLVWKIVYVFVILLLMASAAFVFIFIYGNLITIYENKATVQGITSAQNVDIIDVEAYNLASSTIKYKTEATSSVDTKLRNVFEAVSSTASIK